MAGNLTMDGMLQNGGKFNFELYISKWREFYLRKACFKMGENLNVKYLLTPPADCLHHTVT
jgi:hypothetical protein